MEMRVTMIVGLGLAGLFSLNPLPLADRAQAQELCSKPIQPICSTDMLTTTEEAERLRCRDDARRYEDAMTEYRNCLNAALKEADEALQKAQSLSACLEAGQEKCAIDVEN